MKKARLIFSVVLALMGFSACGGQTADVTETSAPSETTLSETETETESTTETTTESASAEEGYFEWAAKTIADSSYEEKDTKPYGSFEYKSYFSNTAGRETGVNILLPPNYSEDKEYPVLYILHGFWDTEEWMARDIVGIPKMLTELY